MISGTFLEWNFSSNCVSNLHENVPKVTTKQTLIFLHEFLVQWRKSNLLNLNAINLMSSFKIVCCSLILLITRPELKNRTIHSDDFSKNNKICVNFAIWVLYDKNAIQCWVQISLSLHCVTIYFSGTLKNMQNSKKI